MLQLLSLPFLNKHNYAKDITASKMDKQQNNGGNRHPAGGERKAARLETTVPAPGALHEAARQGNVEASVAFVALGAKVNAVNATQRTPLFTATMFGKVKARYPHCQRC